MSKTVKSFKNITYMSLILLKGALKVINIELIANKVFKNNITPTVFN